MRDDAHAQDKKLQDSGAVIGTAGSPIQVRNHDAANVETTSGAFMKSALPVAGFALIEADSLDQAIEMVSKSPCAVAQGVVEVWPLEQPK